MKTIIVGIGNPILGDDGIGIHVVRTLKKQLTNDSSLCIEEAYTGGMNLLDLLKGYERAILIDAVSFSQMNPGIVKQYALDSFQTIHANNPHDVSFPEALRLAETLGDKQLPKDIVIIGVNVPYLCNEFSESLSPKIQQSIPEAVNLVKTILVANKKTKRNN